MSDRWVQVCDGIKFVDQFLRIAESTPGLQGDACKVARQVLLIIQEAAHKAKIALQMGDRVRFAFVMLCQIGENYVYATSHRGLASDQEQLVTERLTRLKRLLDEAKPLVQTVVARGWLCNTCSALAPHSSVSRLAELNADLNLQVDELTQLNDTITASIVRMICELQVSGQQVPRLDPPGPAPDAAAPGHDGHLQGADARLTTRDASLMTAFLDKMGLSQDRPLPTELEWSSKSLEESDAEHIAQLISDRRFSGVRKLVLTRTELSPGFILSLSEALSAPRMSIAPHSTLTALCELNLSKTKLGASGMRAFAAALKLGALQGLKMLDLSLNEIGDDGMEYFSDALSRREVLPKLESLYLDTNGIRLKGFEAFAKAIAKGTWGTSGRVTVCLAGNTLAPRDRERLEPLILKRGRFRFRGTRDIALNWP